MPRILKVIKEPSANKHLLVPLNIGEKVIVVDDDGNDDNYIKIRHNKGQSISRFSKTSFGEINAR